MATQDWSPSMFAGQSWSAWADMVPLTDENDDDGLLTSQLAEQNTDDSMKLRKKDMHLFGLCPSQDELFLVLCEKCNKTLKPQAFKQHMVQRHGVKDTQTKRPGSTSHNHHGSKLHISHSKDEKRSSSVSTSPHTVPTKASVKQTPPNITALAKARQISTLKSSSSTCVKEKIDNSSMKVKKSQSLPFVKVERIPDPLTLKKTLAINQESTVKTIVNNGTLKPVIDLEEKVDVILEKPEDVEKIPLNPPFLPLIKPIPKLMKLSTPPVISPISKIIFSSPSSTISDPSVPPPPLQVVKSELCVKPIITSTVTNTTPISVVKPLTSSNTMSSKSSSITNTAKLPVKEKFLPCKDREYDSNKHCGVWIEDIQRSCTRSLTCKTHALSLRRGVKGRCKPFDDLLKEHRIAKEALLKAKALAAGLPPPTSKYSHLLEASEAGSVAGANSSHSKPNPYPSSTSPLKTNKTPNKLTGPAFQRLSVSGIYPAQTTVGDEPGHNENSIHMNRVGISSDGEGDEVLDRDPIYLSRQPKPAAICNFGARMISGSRFSFFNRKSDFMRAAVISALEKHLHPPPHKKLCVESNLPKDSHIVTNAVDPYEFMDIGAAGSANNFNSLFNSSMRTAGPIKQKSKLAPSRTSKPVGSRSPGSSNPVPSVMNVNPAKRRRSGSNQGNVPSTVISQNFTNVITSLPLNSNNSNTHSPIATISIPSVNIAGQFSTAGKTNHLQLQKNNIINKDGQVNFVLTGIDPSLARNGCVNITATQLGQVYTTEDKKSRISVAGSKTNNKLVNPIEGIKTFANSVFTLPQNAVYMDSSLQSALLAQMPNLTSSSNTIMSLTSPTVTTHQVHETNLTNGINSPTDKNIVNHQQFVTGHKSITTQGVPLIQTSGSINQVPGQIFTSQTQLNPIQVKSSNLNINQKVAMQPVSVTIPIIRQSNLSALAGQQTQHTFVLRTNTDESGQRQEIHLQQPLSSSSTNLIS